MSCTSSAASLDEASGPAPSVDGSGANTNDQGASGPNSTEPGHTGSDSTESDPLESDNPDNDNDTENGIETDPDSTPTTLAMADDPSPRVTRARAQLRSATVVERFQPETAYDRDLYQPRGWPDSDGDCQSDRHEVLQEESLVPVTFTANGCRVAAGEWVDLLTGEILTTAEEATIDHVVPLAAAHRAGGWAWDDATRQAFGSDLDEPASLAVASQAANQAKGDKEPDRWRPSDPARWCRYAVDWITVKTRWELAYTFAEVSALDEMLDSCEVFGIAGDPDGQPLPPEPLAPGPNTPEPGAPGGVTTTTPSAPVPPVELVPEGEGRVRLASCDRRAEVVVLENPGTSLFPLNGWVLHDERRNHELALDPITLGPGERLRILTGDAPSDAPSDASGAFVWKRESIWNNDGDTAFLVDTNGRIADQVSC